MAPLSLVYHPSDSLNEIWRTFDRDLDGSEGPSTLGGKGLAWLRRFGGGDQSKTVNTTFASTPANDDRLEKRNRLFRLGYATSGDRETGFQCPEDTHVPGAWVDGGNSFSKTKTVQPSDPPVRIYSEAEGIDDGNETFSDALESQVTESNGPGSTANPMPTHDDSSAANAPSSNWRGMSTSAKCTTAAAALGGAALTAYLAYEYGPSSFGSTVTSVWSAVSRYANPVADWATDKSTTVAQSAASGLTHGGGWVRENGPGYAASAATATGRAVVSTAVGMGKLLWALAPDEWDEPFPRSGH